MQNDINSVPTESPLFTYVYCPNCFDQIEISNDVNLSGEGYLVKLLLGDKTRLKCVLCKYEFTIQV